MQKIGIVGGGLSGLSVALGCARAGVQVTVFEEDERFGGQIFTERVPVAGGSLVVEHGAEGFVASSVVTEELARSLGIERNLVAQTSNLSFIFDGESIRELAPGEAARLLGFQVKQEELGRGVRSFQDGSGELTDALVAQSLRAGAELRTKARVDSVAHNADHWELLVNGELSRRFDALVLALPARPAATLLQPILGPIAERLRRAPLLSSVNVTLAYPTAELPVLAGTGFITSGVGGFRACSYASLKLPGRAPAGYVLLRAFFRPEAGELETLSDADWMARAVAVIQAALRFSAVPVLARVARWQDALPVHTVEHRTAVAEVEARLAGQHIFLVGSAFHGSGIDAALRSANTALAQLLAEPG